MDLHANATFSAPCQHSCASPSVHLAALQLTAHDLCRAGSTYLAYVASALLKANDLGPALHANMLLLGRPPLAAYVAATQPHYVAEPETGKVLSLLPASLPGQTCRYGVRKAQIQAPSTCTQLCLADAFQPHQAQLALFFSSLICSSMKMQCYLTLQLHGICGARQNVLTGFGRSIAWRLACGSWRHGAPGRL
jgi:hypothetical protein